MRKVRTEVSQADPNTFASSLQDLDLWRRHRAKFSFRPGVGGVDFPLFGENSALFSFSHLKRVLMHPWGVAEGIHLQYFVCIAERNLTDRVLPT